MQNLVTFTELPNGNLLIEPRADSLADIADCGSFWDVIEYQTCNGWEGVDPAEVGALTGAEIISREAVRDDTGKLVSVGRVYAFMDYQIVDPVAALASGQAITLVGA